MLGGQSEGVEGGGCLLEFGTSTSCVCMCLCVCSPGTTLVLAV